VPSLPFRKTDSFETQIDPGETNCSPQINDKSDCMRTFPIEESLSLIIVLFDQLLSRILLEVRRETSFAKCKQKCKIPEIALTETYNIIIIVILYIMVWVGFVFQTRILYLKLQVFRYNISNE
jgi:hypothetical protein